MTLTKARIVENIHNDLGRVGFSKADSADLVEKIFELVKSSLESDEDVLISGFGKFCVRKKHERRGRNPHSGSPMMLPRRKVVTFKCSGILREKVNDSAAASKD